MDNDLGLEYNKLRFLKEAVKPGAMIQSLSRMLTFNPAGSIYIPLI
jgi:hypothetical protein